MELVISALFEHPEKQLYQRIEAVWKESNTWPDFSETMRKALAPHQPADDRKKIGLSGWMLLPGLCCQAAEGDPHWADDLAAAWILLYSAANIMDHVEDRDQPDPWWQGTGPGVAVNAATGLYFTASQILNQLYAQEATFGAARDIVEDYYSSFLRMSSGQHRDLVQPNPTLEQCWEVASAKSGTFFSFACRAGARLATAESSRVEGFSRFGHHLGVLVQILDDLQEIQLLQKAEPSGANPEYSRSLGVVFAFEVYPPETRQLLKKHLQFASIDREASIEVYRLIEQSGAGLYLTTEMERHQSLALTALEEAAVFSPAREALEALILRLVSI